MLSFSITGLPKIRFAHVFRAAGYKTDFPAHTGLIEITYIAGGRLTAVRSGKRITAEAGDITVDRFEIPQHQFADAPHEHHTVGFDVPFLPDADGLCIPYLTRDSRALEPIRARIDEIIRHHSTFPEDTLTSAGLFLQLLAELDAYHRGGHAHDTASLHAKKAKQYISDHLHEPISQKAVAAHLGITPEYLCDVFKKSEGESLIRYVNRRKLSAIAAMMESEPISLSEAAALYGFADPNYVSRLYKSYFGRTVTDALREMNTIAP